MLPKRKKWNGRVSVIIVSYNYAAHVAKCIDALRNQTVPPYQIILVDTGSKERSYLEQYQNHAEVILAEPECGFCAGNNLGYLAVKPDTDAVLFLNPDAFLFPDFLEHGLDYLSRNSNVGAVTGLTLGYDFEANTPTGLIDTTGIFSTWYGKWYDRCQGSLYIPDKAPECHQVPAICGAVFFCRKSALDQVKIGRHVMNGSFYMYKEDIDLSLRLKNKKWQLMHVPALKAYHCRGWGVDRKKMQRKYRLFSARNDLRVNWKRKHAIGTLYSLTKLLAVKVLNW